MLWWKNLHPPTMKGRKFAAHAAGRLSNIGNIVKSVGVYYQPWAANCRPFRKPLHEILQVEFIVFGTFKTVARRGRQKKEAHE